MRGRGFFTIEDVRLNCRIDPATHCWHWLGAKCADGVPRIWTVDHERIEKRSMSGPKGLWNIAHGQAPRKGWLVFRSCMCTDCMNPAHLSQAASKADIGLHIRRCGNRKGTALEARRANALLAQAASGIVVTPPDVVRAIRACDRSTSNSSIARTYGLSNQTVGKIRRGESHRSVV